MKQVTLAEFENKSICALNRNLGFTRFICKECQDENYQGYRCHCGAISSRLHPTLTIFKDCGCLASTYGNLMFTIQKYKNFKLPSTPTKNFDIIPFLNKFNIRRWIHVKIGASTKIPFNLSTDHNIINGGNITDIRYGMLNINMPSYSLCTPKENNKMLINGIPCKLFYTEYTKSSNSFYHGYFVNHIIAFDYDIINEHIKRCKTLQILRRNKKSLLSKLPKEIMSIIRDYIILEFNSIYR
jgi:hypothetical protein